VVRKGICMGKRRIGRPRRRRSYNIKMISKEMRWDMYWIDLVQVGTGSGILLPRQGNLLQ
jgi:hypothetical protein